MTTTSSILTQENFSALMQWLSGEEGQAPDFAPAFMTSLDALYMSRSGLPIRRASRTPATRLSLESVIENARKENESGKNSQTTLDEIEQPKAQQTNGTMTGEAAEPSRLGSDTLPIRNGDGFLEAGLDSVLVAKAIGHYYGQLSPRETSGKPMTMSFLQLTLFVVYGTMLAERGTRLTAETPQMWQYGPVFPKVYRKLTKDTTTPEEAAASIREKDPSLDEFIQRMTRNHAAKKISEITRLHTSITSPWGQCRKAHPDAWGTMIDDKTTAIWFRRFIDKNQLSASPG